MTAQLAMFAAAGDAAATSRPATLRPEPARNLAAEAAAILAAGVPSDHGRAARAYVGLQADRWRVYFATDQGRGAAWVGPSFPAERRGIRDVATLCRLVNEGLGYAG